MKSVLISIRPKWCEKIASGKKTVEVRKTKPNIPTPFKCYIYCTNQRVNGEILLTYDKKVEGRNRGFRYEGDIPLAGKVIGEFECKDILNFALDPYGHVCADDLKASCLTTEDLWNYAKGKTLYGWHISDLKIYDKPKELCEFFCPCEKQKYPYCFDCEHGLQKGEERQIDGMRHYDVPCGNWLKRPPQSWCYVEEMNNG